MRLLATRLDEAAGEITRLQGGSVAVGLPITAPRELAHYERPLRDLVEWCHSSAADLRRRAAVAAQADLIPSSEGANLHEALKTAAAGGIDAELAAFDMLGADVADFFAGLTPGRALAVALARAGEVGGRGGAPFELRFAANRHLVRLAHAEAVRVGDKAAADRYKRLLEPGRRLLLFDPRGAGRIAEVKGDLSSATSVTVMVPGTGNDLSTYDRSPLGALLAVHRLADRFSRGKTATIMWLGTDLPPNVPAAATRLYAERGGPKLREFMEGLDLADSVNTTAIGHSYGSTVTGHAVRAGLKVDNLVAVASPGWGVDEAADLKAPTTRLYAVRHPDDFISVVPPIDGLAPPLSSLGHGADPVFMDGVTRMASGNDDQLLPVGVNLDAHSDYFAGAGRSRVATHNIAVIVAGGCPTTFEAARAAR